MSLVAAPTKPSPPFKAKLIDCIALALICAAIYVPGMNAIGLVNWQEGQRALVAREMLRADEWVVPTRGGEVYLAKPPAIYWCQMLLARARGAEEVGAVDLRTTVAIAATLGVIMTYLLALMLAQSPRKRAIALYSALGLAVGMLYVRSARIGELDILLVPTVIGAIGALHRADLCAHRPALRWSMIALAAILCALAALTKGPPAIAIIALVAFGAPAWSAARAHGARINPTACAIGALIFFAITAFRITSVTDAISALMHGGIGAIVGAYCSVLAKGGWFKRIVALHPEVVIGAGVLALWAWGWLVAQSAGDEIVRAAADREAADNLRIFDVDSPFKNAGFLAYGMLPIGLFAWIELWRIVARRAPAGRGLVLCVVWACAGFVLMSVAGKGVARYLTPIWPALAILGGAWCARELRTPGRRALGIAVLATSAIFMGVWYGAVRPARAGDTSPQRIIEELTARGATPATLGTFGFDAPAAAFYAGDDIRYWALADWELAAREIAQAAREQGGFYLLVRAGDVEPQRVHQRNSDLSDRFTGQGFAIEPIATDSAYVRDRSGSEVAVWLVSPR